MQPELLGYGRQFIDSDDIEAVRKVLVGSHLTQGAAVGEFESGLSRATGARHAIVCSNGSVALQLAYLALDVGPGTVVETTAVTFLSTATAALHCGARVRFSDIDGGTANLDLDALESRLSGSSPPEIVTVVHFAGLPADMRRLLELKQRFGFRLVEDASHALGARYCIDGRWWLVGEHPEVDATILSFHPVKHITTGEGGAVLTHDAELAARLFRARDHGVDRQLAEPSYAPMVELGLNGRLSDIQAALGTSQLRKLPDFLAARREIAHRYIEELDGFERLDAGGGDFDHAWHLFVIRVDAAGRDELLLQLRERGIACQVHYHPVPLQPWFLLHHGGADVGPWPMAEDHGKRSLSLPIFPAMTEADQDRVIGALRSWRKSRCAA